MKHDLSSASFTRQLNLFSPSSEADRTRSRNLSLRLDDAGFLTPPKDELGSSELAFHIGFLPAIFVYLPLPFRYPATTSRRFRATTV